MVDIYLGDGALYARLNADGTILMNGGQLVGRFDMGSGAIFGGTPQSSQQIGALLMRPPTSELLGMGQRKVASLTVTFRDPSSFTGLESASIRPVHDKYSVEVKGDGSILLAGAPWGRLMPGPGGPPSLDPVVPFVAVVLTFFVPGLVFSNVQMQVFCDSPGAVPSSHQAAPPEPAAPLTGQHIGGAASGGHASTPTGPPAPSSGIDILRADNSLCARLSPKDGAIYMNGYQVGRYDDHLGHVYKGDAKIGQLQRTNPPFRDVHGHSRRGLASFCMNYRDLKKMKDIDGATIRPYMNPYSVELNNDGSIYIDGETFGRVELGGPGSPDTMEPIFPLVAATLIFFVQGVVLKDLQAQDVYTDSPHKKEKEKENKEDKKKDKKDKKKDEKKDKKKKKEEKKDKKSSKLAGLGKGIAKQASSGGFNIRIG